MGARVPEEKADLAGALEHQDAGGCEAQSVFPSVTTLRTRPGGMSEEQDKQTDITSDLTASSGREHTAHREQKLEFTQRGRRAGSGVVCEIMA